MQPADFSVDKELVDEESLEAVPVKEEALGDDGEDEDAVAAVAETRSLLESPDGSVSHADLGAF